MDLTSDIPDFVKESFVPMEDDDGDDRIPVKNTFEDKWNELGKVILGMYTQKQTDFAFSCIRLSDIISTLGNCITDDHNLWVSPTLPAFIRLTTWARIRTETNFYELAATLGEPKVIFAFESAADVPRSYFYGPQELVAVPRIITAATFVFLLQRFAAQTAPTTTSTHLPVKKKRAFHADPTDESEEDGNVQTSVQSVEIEYASTNVPVCERQRMGNNAQQPPSASEITFDLHEIMSKWKRENKRPTVEKICEMEKLAQRDVKQWLARQNTTWTKMLIQYGFRDTNSK